MRHISRANLHLRSFSGEIWFSQAAHQGRAWSFRHSSRPVVLLQLSPRLIATYASAETASQSLRNWENYHKLGRHGHRKIGNDRHRGLNWGKIRLQIVLKKFRWPLADLLRRLSRQFRQRKERN